MDVVALFHYYSLCGSSIKIMVCVDKLPVRVNNDVESMADFSPFSETPTSGGDDTDGVADDVLSIL